MLPAFVSTQDPSSKSKGKARPTAANSRMPIASKSTGKENRPIQRNPLKNTKIPGPVKAYSSSLSQKKVLVPSNQAKATTHKGEGIKKKPFAQKYSTNAANVKSASKVTVGRDENQEFQIDPVARFNILSEMAAITLSPGKRERNTIGVPFSRKPLGQPKSSRVSLCAGYKKEAYPKDRMGHTNFFGGLVPKNDTTSNKSAAEYAARKENAITNTWSKADDSRKQGLCQDLRAPDRALGTIGPIRRLNLCRMKRNKPYHVDQGKIGAHRKDKEPRKLTFEQKLSVILNDRPGLDGDRRTINMVERKRVDFAAYIPQTTDSRQVRPPLENTTNTITNQNNDNKVPVSIGPVSDGLSGRPKPSLPGQLCQIAYISPRKKRNTTQRGTVRKSPSKSLLELANPTEKGLITPSRSTPRKILSSLKASPCRLTAEALYNKRNGLPLPPKERRYEFVESSKWWNATTPKVAEEAKSKATTDPLMDVPSSAKNKKSVRWADSPYSKQSEAHKRLNFDAVSEQKEFHAEALNLASKLTYNCDLAPHGSSRDQKKHQVTTNIDEAFTYESTGKINHPVIPKPFAGLPIADALRSNIAVTDWGFTPEKGRNDTTQVPFVSSMSGNFERLRGKAADATPSSSAKKTAPNCPAARRTWARTPHAKEEEKRRKKALLDKILNQPVVTSTDTKSSHLTSSSDASEAVKFPDEASREKLMKDNDPTNEDNGEKSDFEKLAERILGRRGSEALNPTIDELKRQFDLSQGVLKVIGEINKWSVREDIKRMNACKFRSAGVQTSFSSSAVKCSPDGSRPSKVTFENLQKPSLPCSSWGSSGVSSNQSQTVSPINEEDKSKPFCSDVESLSNYLSALPKPRSSYRNELQTRSEAGSANVVYSAAPSNIQDFGVPSRDSAFGQVVVSSQINNQVNRKVYSANECSSKQSSQSDLSSGYFSLVDTEDRISAIVENFMSPFRKIIDDAFTARQPSNDGLEENDFVSGTLFTNSRSQDFRKFEGISLDYGSASQIPPKSHIEQSSDLSRTSLLDEEVAFYTKYLEIAQGRKKRKIATRPCKDPVAQTLSHCDSYHFIPIEDQQQP